MCCRAPSASKTCSNGCCPGGTTRSFPTCFLFQAEDGIRDFHVTGVQTCALPISPVQVIPGTTPVKIPKGSSTSPQPPGAYGKVMVRSNATLVLAGGTYVVKSIQVGSRGQLLCADACQIGVADTVTLKPNAVLGGTGGTRAQQIRVNVAKTSRNTVFSAGKQTTVS